jgi:hypothetical protein
MPVQDLTKFDGKKVVIVHNLPEANAKGELAEEIEGTALAANTMGVLLKPKGTTQAILIEIGNIEEINLAPEKPKKLVVRWLKDVEYGNARQHLVSSHGYQISKVEAMAEDAALEFHNTLDHSDLAHRHGEKPAKASESNGTAEAAAE